MRTIEQKLECIKRVIFNTKEHIRYGDPKRMYSQYIRYALDEVSELNFYTSKRAKGLVIPPFITGLKSRYQATMANFCLGVMPPSPILGRSLL